MKNRKSNYASLETARMVEMKFRLSNGNVVFFTFFYFIFFVGPQTIRRHGVGSKRKGLFSRRWERTDATAAAAVYDRYYVIDGRTVYWPRFSYRRFVVYTGSPCVRKHPCDEKQMTVNASLTARLLFCVGIVVFRRIQNVLRGVDTKRIRRKRNVCLPFRTVNATIFAHTCFRNARLG